MATKAQKRMLAARQAYLQANANAILNLQPPGHATTNGDKPREDENMSKNTGFSEVSSEKLDDIIEYTVQNTRLNLAIQGVPGTAKTKKVQGVCVRNSWALVPFRLGDRESVEVCGAQMPDIKTGTMRRYLPDFLGRVNDLSEKHERVVIFFDEFNKAADPATMNAARQMILDREIEGVYQFPENVRFIIAVNRIEDRSGDEAIPSHVANSFMWVGVQPSAEDLIKHALDSDWHPAIPAYLSWRSRNVHMFDPKRIVNVTYRSWEYVNEILQAKESGATLSASQARAMVGGCIGGLADEFMGFIKTYLSTLEHDKIVSDPLSAPLPDCVSNPELPYAIVSSCSAMATVDNLESYVIYVERLCSPEHEALFLRMCESKSVETDNPDHILTQTSAYGRLATKLAA